MLFGSLLIGAAMAAGCSGSSKRPDGTPSVTPAAVVTVAISTPTPLSADLETAVAAQGNVDMVDYTDPGGRYTAKVPRGWQQAGGQNALSYSLPDSPLPVILDIRCQPGLTADAAIAGDDRALKALSGGSMDIAGARTRTVAGVAAREISITGGVANIDRPRLAVYFEGRGCAWRVGLAVSRSLGTWRPIFDRLLDSFTFTP